MAAWRKTLKRLLVDTDPHCRYRYEELAAILAALQFEVAPSGGSHRKWRRKLTNGLTAYVGLKKDDRPLKGAYVREMIAELRKHGLIPPDFERDA